MRLPTLPIALAAVLAARTFAGAAVTAAPGWAVRTLPTPATLQGGVVRAGEAVLVGQGPTFTAGAQTIVRLDAGGATTIAAGFNSLGGFALDGGGILWVVDNGGELPGAATGDTLFAVPDALTRTTALAAADAAVLPAGAIPSAFDVALVPGAVLVSDAAGPGAGRVLRVAGGSAVPFLDGFHFTAGLALDPGGTLLVADVDGFTFAGSVSRFALDGTPLGTLVDGLSGAYALAVDGEGDVLVSGGFTPDFSSATIVAVAPDGAVSERARGFAFASEIFFDAARDELLVVDFGATDLVAICRERDGDGTCDADDPCTGGVPLGGAVLKVGRVATPPGDETLVLKGELLLPQEAAAGLDPRATGVRVVVEGAAGPILDAIVPAGAFDRATKTGWKVNRADTAWTYRSPGGPAGIRKVVVKRPGGGAVVRAVVVGKGGAYPAGEGALPLGATLALDAPVARTGRCGEAVFAPGGCTVNRRGTAVRCR
jgi:hypothetical protein